MGKTCGLHPQQGQAARACSQGRAQPGVSFYCGVRAAAPQSTRAHSRSLSLPRTLRTRQRPNVRLSCSDITSSPSASATVAFRRRRPRQRLLLLLLVRQAARPDPARLPRSAAGGRRCCCWRCKLVLRKQDLEQQGRVLSVLRRLLPLLLLAEAACATVRGMFD